MKIYGKWLYLWKKFWWSLKPFRLFCIWVHWNYDTGCEDCGKDCWNFQVPDDLWLMVVGRKGGYLCFDCFCSRAEKKDIHFHGGDAIHLVPIPFTENPWDSSEFKEAVKKLGCKYGRN